MGDSKTAAKIVQLILQGDADGDLEMVYSAYKTRKDVVAQQNLMTLRVNQRVKLFGLRLKVLNGQAGVITALPRSANSRRFDVKLDNDIILHGRATNLAFGIPAACIQVIE